MAKNNPINNVVLSIHPMALHLTIFRGDNPKTYTCFPVTKKYDPIERSRRMSRIASRMYRQTDHKIWYNTAKKNR